MLYKLTTQDNLTMAADPQHKTKWGEGVCHEEPADFTFYRLEEGVYVPPSSPADVIFGDK